MRPSANVTNWRPIAPPYNNFAPVLFTIFVGLGTCHSSIDLGSLCWHSFRDSPNSSVQPKFRFRLKLSLRWKSCHCWLGQQTVCHRPSKKLTESTSLSNLFQVLLNLKYEICLQKNTFFSHKLKPTTAFPLQLKLHDWCLHRFVSLCCDESGLFLLTPGVSGPGSVYGLWSPLSAPELQWPPPGDSPACCLTRGQTLVRVMSVPVAMSFIELDCLWERVGKKLCEMPT